MKEIGGSYCCKPEYQCQYAAEPPKGKSKDKGKKVEKGKRVTVNPVTPPVKTLPPHHPDGQREHPL